MKKLKTISMAACMMATFTMTSIVHAESATTVPEQATAALEVASASFGSCYMDSFMAPQRFAQRKLGNVGGLAAMTIIDAAYGAGTAAWIAFWCAAG